MLLRGGHADRCRPDSDRRRDQVTPANAHATNDTSRSPGHLPSRVGRSRAVPAPPDDPFARHRWHAEVAAQAAVEAWNYNASHEELYGLQEGLTFGLRDGLLLTMTQRMTYVSQRAQDAWVLGVTGGIRRRIYRHGRLSAFLGVEIGISDTALAAPPRGTRFNYLLIGNGGVLLRSAPRASRLVAAVDASSNASLKGPGRNPDIEAVGATVGLFFGF